MRLRRVVTNPNTHKYLSNNTIQMRRRRRKWSIKLNPSKHRINLNNSHLSLRMYLELPRIHPGKRRRCHHQSRRLRKRRNMKRIRMMRTLWAGQTEYISN
jgi:hypothetical protein